MARRIRFAQLTAVACHDLRTPLATVYGFSRTLARIELGEPAAAYVEMIEAASSQVGELLDQLERVDLGEGRLIAALGDTRDQDELVEEIGDLSRGLVDHLDVTWRRICELDPGERPCQPVHSGQRRTNVAAYSSRPAEFARKAFVGQGAATLAA